MGQPIVPIDAFTSKVFAGNPAVVRVLREPRDDAWMLNAADEMHCSETASRDKHATEGDLGRKYELVSRFLAPAIGIPEGPVTGSAHCCLGPYRTKRTKKASFHAVQAPSCGGAVHVRVAGDCVIISGQAVTVLPGELLK